MQLKARKQPKVNFAVFRSQIAQILVEGNEIKSA